MTSEAASLTAVMPALNEEEGLADAVAQVAAALGRTTPSWQIVVVDDGSTDRTAEVARGLAAADPRVSVEVHGRNLGIGAAMRTGIAAARCDYVMIVPADIAFDLAALPGMFAAARTCDVLVCLRSDRRDYTLFRRLVSVCYIAFIRALYGLKCRQFNYIHVYRREIFRTISFDSSGVFFHAEVLIRASDAGFRLVEHVVPYVPRTSGVQKGARPATIRRTISDALSFRRRGRGRGAAPLVRPETRA
jgi:glycosyltransferase involved in cell wall biosynthesis